MLSAFLGKDKPEGNDRLGIFPCILRWVMEDRGEDAEPGSRLVFSHGLFLREQGNGRLSGTLCAWARIFHEAADIFIPFIFEAFDMKNDLLFKHW